MHEKKNKQKKKKRKKSGKTEKRKNEKKKGEQNSEVLPCLKFEMRLLFLVVIFNIMHCKIIIIDYWFGYCI